MPRGPGKAGMQPSLSSSLCSPWKPWHLAQLRMGPVVHMMVLLLLISSFHPCPAPPPEKNNIFTYCSPFFMHNIWGWCTKWLNKRQLLSRATFLTNKSGGKSKCVWVGISCPEEQQAGHLGVGRQSPWVRLITKML